MHSKHVINDKIALADEERRNVMRVNRFVRIVFVVGFHVRATE